jgi:hypothetical protein
MEVRKWLRQQSKDFYAAGFDVSVRIIRCPEVTLVSVEHSLASKT